MASLFSIIINFIASLVVSSALIYIIAKFLGEKEDFGTAVKAAIIGAIIYALAYAFLGPFASIIGGVAWLLVLKSLYSIGWGKALVIAIVVWLVASLAGVFLPTLTGPL